MTARCREWRLIHPHLCAPRIFAQAPLNETHITQARRREDVSVRSAPDKQPGNALVCDQVLKRSRTVISVARLQFCSAAL
jgi:hypothetical protein